MSKSRQRLAAIATWAALGLVFAGVADASTASTDADSSHKPVSGNYPGSYTASEDAPTWAAAQRHPSHKPLSGNDRAGYAPAADYPNHKPVSGNYPDSYPTSASIAATEPSDTIDPFDWSAAGVGAAAMLGLVLLLAAVKAGGARARQRIAV
jgi:hypothetical protein